MDTFTADSIPYGKLKLEAIRSRWYSEWLLWCNAVWHDTLQIFDGGNSTSQEFDTQPTFQDNSVWSRPVISSSGPQIFISFKGGPNDYKRHIGFKMTFWSVSSKWSWNVIFQWWVDNKLRHLKNIIDVQKNQFLQNFLTKQLISKGTN